MKHDGTGRTQRSARFLLVASERDGHGGVIDT